MSFERDLHICVCGHLRRDHSSNLKTKCLFNPCNCVKFQRRLKKRNQSRSKPNIKNETPQP